MADTLRLSFLGTRGEIQLRSAQHRRHSALLVSAGTSRVMIDCGADWLGRVPWIHPTAILLTHAHPDHVAGLAGGAPCPVYATPQTWTLIRCYPIAERRTIRPGEPLKIGALRIEAVSVAHSVRAPAVGFRISHGPTAIFYVPDVAAIGTGSRVLDGVSLYIGDGATIDRPLIRRRGRTRIGHATIRTQLGWCARAGVTQTIFTHCGSALVRADGRRVAATVRRLGRHRGIAARIAHDGLRLVVRPAHRKKSSRVR